MFNKIFTFLLAVVFSLCTFALTANAQISSINDMIYKKNQLQQIYNTDFLSFINKNEMIGYRLNSFNMDTQFYKNNVKGVIEKIDNSVRQIQLIQNSADISDTEKSMQIGQIYQDIDISLYDLDAKTITFISNCRHSMPTITFQRFSKKFENFYNSFRISTTQVSVY